MKNTFKKIAASVMAVASLASVMVGMSASAASGSRSFGNGATAYLSVSNTSVYGSTSIGTATNLSVSLHDYGGGSGNPVGSTNNGTKVSAQVWGSNYTYATSTHVAGSSRLDPDMTVWN